MSTTSQPEHPGTGEPVWRVPLALRLRLLEALSAEPERVSHVRLTYEEFLDWLEEDTLAEWVDGEVIVTRPASLRHQELADFLLSVLRGYAEMQHLGLVLSAPFQMRLATTGREPDVLFVAQEHRDRLQPTYLAGPADLVVEIISPESVGRDRGDKFFEYERAGIPEYWLIDPQTDRAEFYQLDIHGRYQLMPPDTSGVYRAAVLPGFWLRVTWLWDTPLPAADDVLLDVGGEAYALRLIERLRSRGYLREP